MVTGPFIAGSCTLFISTNTLNSYVTCPAPKGIHPCNPWKSLCRPLCQRLVNHGPNSAHYVSVNKVDWTTAVLIRLRIVCHCFHTTKAEFKRQRPAATRSEWSANYLLCGLSQKKFTNPYSRPCLLHHSTSQWQAHLKIRARKRSITLTWDTAQASSGFSRRRRENSIRTLQAAATDWSWFRGTEK